MPDANGWHDAAFLVDGRSMRWHYCAGAELDVLVPDTPAARKEHERECTRRARAEQQAAERRRRREATERLRRVTRLRAESRSA